MLQKIREYVHHYITLVENILYPDNCLGCKKNGEILCRACIEKIPPPEETIPFGRALFSSNHTPLRRAIWLLKYRGRKSIVHIFAPLLADLILDELSEEALANSGLYIITAVPLSAQKLQKRGFNQSELLAQEAAKILGLPFKQVVKKVKETQSQVGLTRKKRLENVRGAFATSTPLTGKNILVIDDIITTGATLKEVAKTLKDAGAKRILSFTIGHQALT